MKQKIVIVGGGFGGVKTALELANKPGIEIKLISNTMNFEYHGALYRTATGGTPLEVIIPLKKIFKRAKNVEIILDEIEHVNPKRKTLKSANGDDYIYDLLVLALGNCVNYFGIEGMEDHSFAMVTTSQALRLRNHLKELFISTKSSNPPKIVVVGAGPTGVEIAGAVSEFARQVTKKYHKKAVHPDVEIIEGTDRILPMFDPVLSAKAYKRLHKLGVKTQLSTRVNSCEPGKVCLDGGDIEADVIIWTAGSQIVDFYAKNSRIFKIERGRVKVGEHMLADGHDDIYVIGDNANTPFSGMAQTAIHDAKFVARDILARHKRKLSPKYRVWHPIYVVPIGERWAVFQTTKRQLSGYAAWLWRRRADRWIFKNFLPEKTAIKQWRAGNKAAKF